MSASFRASTTPQLDRFCLSKVFFRDASATTHGPRACSGRQDGTNDEQQGTAHDTDAAMSASLGLAYDPTASPNTPAAPVRRRADAAGGTPERLAAFLTLKSI